MTTEYWLILITITLHISNVEINRKQIWFAHTQSYNIPTDTIQFETSICISSRCACQCNDYHSHITIMNESLRESAEVTTFHCNFARKYCNAHCACTATATFSSQQVQQMYLQNAFASPIEAHRSPLFHLTSAGIVSIPQRCAFHSSKSKLQIHDLLICKMHLPIDIDHRQTTALLLLFLETARVKKSNSLASRVHLGSQ